MRIVLLSLLSLAFLSGCATNAPTPSAVAPSESETELGAILRVGRLNQVETGVFAGGQPTVSEIEYLAQQGVLHVINLRPIEEQPFAEQAVVEGAGMRYYSIPVASAADLTVDNALQLAALLDEFGHEGVAVHCASGNRVGALVAIAAAEMGASEDDAIEKGKEWGLTRLETKAREVIEVE
ncbi:fused DSP-PTPase phosphatase/NAD kinase-like protein [Umboniibacter marinipuniceus]|uniref:Uncharacterized protein (TIGR01244 family) n=1 Tax=Umboniibacter marinipuniceus TaxID=569599 RepID=A0A3M0A8U7_9GAMM|nr:sulfur transferase domain-containing protein [Umboniibacter marinipuniceus]RMA78835.1 uncharacterized protein (TIGR01244 family) [Umboniibacter marinipuniceus]